jgi:hypothetical protein
MSSTMTLTLPLRLTKPSLSLDPTFALLYEDNESALKHFLDNKSPLPLKDVLKTTDFMEYLVGCEPGPKVQYQNLRPSLSALRGFLLSTDKGKTLLAFFKELLQIQGHWLIAAAEQHAFDLYCKLTQALLIDGDDEKLATHFIKMVPDAASKLAFPLTRSQFDMLVADEQARLRQVTREAALKLFHFKTATIFWNRYTSLLAAIDAAEQTLTAVRADAARRKHAHDARRKAAYARNSLQVHRQMGTPPAAPHTPQAEASIAEWVRGLKEGVLSFNDAVS